MLAEQHKVGKLHLVHTVLHKEAINHPMVTVHPNKVTNDHHSEEVDLREDSLDKDNLGKDNKVKDLKVVEIYLQQSA